MKIALLVFVLSFSCISLAGAQTKSKNVTLLNSAGNAITLGTPVAVTNNSIIFPGTLGAQGAMLYISSVAGAAGTTAWLNPGTNGYVLTLAAGIPTWANPASTGWQLIGNASTTPGVGAGQNYLGTSDVKDLVFATSATERMRILSTGNIAVNSATAPQLFTIGGDIGVVGSGSKVTASGTANELIMEETTDTYGTSRLRVQHRNGSNGALFETVPNAANVGVDLVDFGFKPGAKVQSNIRLEARSADLRGTQNITSATGTEFQFLFGSTTTPQYVLSIGQGATLLESGKFGIGYSAGSGTFPVASPLELLDVHTGNIILSNTGTASVTGTAGILKFQGTKDGISSFAAGGQGSNTFNYTLPAVTPTAGQVLTVNTISGATPYAVALSWATPASGATSFADNVFSVFNSTTNTKIAAFSSASISAATTRTFTFPDVNGTLITSGNLSSITATGTITSGTWNGTVIAATAGGTGQSTYTLGDILYSSFANTLGKLAGNTTATKKFLTQTGTGAVSAAPAWNTISSADVPAMVASGASHAAGLAPDPGSMSGSTKFLREDATWAVPSPSSSISHLGANSGANSTNNNFLQLGGFGDNTTENKTQIVITRSATLQNLYVNLTAAPGAGTSKTVTVRVNGANTALAVTISGAATTGNNTANTISVSAGDLLSIEVNHSGSVAGSVIAMGMEIAM